MNDWLSYLWLIPALPVLASLLLTFWPVQRRKEAALLATGAMALSFLGALAAFWSLSSSGEAGQVTRLTYNFTWFDMGTSSVRIGWLLDPLNAMMLLMVTFVATLVLIYSMGYMAKDPRMVRFYAFLSLFAGAMLALLIANHLLILFMCWEVVGLASYLLIGFWYEKPSAAAAAKKAFITTRVGDIGLFIGMIWLYREAGTLLFFDAGQGCMEQTALAWIAKAPGIAGLTAAASIGCLIFFGAMGKSGQFPLHAWLPDAMEGPTPVSALIHAATMVAAGVFLMARIYPMLAFEATGTGALVAITWIGAITALLGALVACAQTDLKRILAFSTISQLGYMMLGLGTGGVAVAMFHLITHAFFKALLFLGAGSVIHGCGDEQDIRYMGGLRRAMPVTFATYAIGMLALAGFPLVTSGFWSKDEILHAALHWHGSPVPFAMALAGAFLTAFYMTRQMCHVFFGRNRLGLRESTEHHPVPEPHESPATMLIPLRLLAILAIGTGFLGTPLYPWFHTFLEGGTLAWNWGALLHGSALILLLGSSALVLTGLGIGWWYYSSLVFDPLRNEDPLEDKLPGTCFTILRAKFFVDEFYAATVVRGLNKLAWGSAWLEQRCFVPMLNIIPFVTQITSWIMRLWDEWVINAGFDRSCRGINNQARRVSEAHTGRIQSYLQVIAVGFIILAIFWVWGGEG
jgi:NADH-quinone oxidoreductase subunit L